MPRVPCSYCGLPFHVRRVDAGHPAFCCSGCAVASRLPAADASGQFPITKDLVFALGSGFAFFNELLSWTLALAVAREGRAAPALAFAWISAGLGAAVWIALAAGIGRAGTRRWGDGGIILVSLAAVIHGFWPPVSAGWLVAGNAALALWLCRGWGKKKFTRK